MGIAMWSWSDSGYFYRLHAFLSWWYDRGPGLHQAYGAEHAEGRDITQSELKRKQKIAGMSSEYLETVFTAGIQKPTLSQQNIHALALAENHG